jgi:methyl-accepting chemotaxis protein
MSANSNIKVRLSYNQINEATGALLREYKDFIMLELPAVLDGFYDHISRFSETSALFKNREHMMGAKQAQLRHWSMIMDGRFDEGYEASISKIGETHNRIGLDPRWYIGGYNGLVTGLLGVIARKLPSARSANPVIERMTKERGIDRKTALQEAVVKAAMMDIDIAIGVYLESGRREKRATLERLAQDFERAVTGVIASVGATARELQGAADAMSYAARITADRSTAVAAAAEEASANVQTVAVVAEQLSSSVREIGRQVSNSTDIAGKASRSRWRRACSSRIALRCSPFSKRFIAWG